MASDPKGSESRDSKDPSRRTRKKIKKKEPIFIQKMRERKRQMLPT